MKLGKIGSVHLALVALAAGGVALAAGGPSPASTAPLADVGAQAQTAPAAHDPAGEGEDQGAESAGVVDGTVLEVIDVPSYTYVRLGEPGTPGTWAAVSSAKLRVGDRVVVRDASEMQNFASSTLKRTFDSIWFGSLDDGTGQPAKDAHAVGAALRAETASPASSADPHANAGKPTLADVKAVARATGPNGHTVAEILGSRAALAGKPVAVHATVVKATAGVLGKNWLHVRDGSGDDAKSTSDLTVTTSEELAVGAVVTLEGTLATDRDLGSGYRYAAILEDAKVVAR